MQRRDCTDVGEALRQVLHGLDADCCVPAEAYYPSRLAALRAAVEAVESGGAAAAAARAPRAVAG